MSKDIFIIISSFIILLSWGIVMQAGAIGDIRSIRPKKKRTRMFCFFVITFFAGSAIAQLISLIEHQ